MKVILLIALLVLVIVIGPLATLWSLNTLFPILNIPYSFDTWAAALILGGALTFRKSKD
jgi:hypothetical protein